MNIFVTGSEGFVGRNLIPKLEDHEVVKNKNFDVRDSVNIPYCDLVINLASLNSSKESIERPGEYFATNEWGNFNMLEQARQIGAKFMYLATVKDTEINPYGMSKAAASRWVQTYNETYGMETIINRVGNLYGPGGDNFFLNQFVKKAVQGESITVYGDGEDRRTLLHVNDLVDLMVKQINEWEEWHDFDEYHVSGGKENEVSVNDILMYLEVKDAQYQDQLRGQVKITSNDNSELKEMGWKPTIHWKEGVKELMELYA